MRACIRRVKEAKGKNKGGGGGRHAKSKHADEEDTAEQEEQQQQEVVRLEDQPKWIKGGKMREYQVRGHPRHFPPQLTAGALWPHAQDNML